MMKFECLIRAGSHFSRFVERLGQTKLVLYPDGYKRVGKDTIINVIGLKTRLSSGKWKSEKIKL